MFYTQPSRLDCQKYVRKRKGAVKMRMTVFKILVYRYVTKMYKNCVSIQVAHRTQNGYKTRDQKCICLVLKRIKGPQVH